MISWIPLMSYALVATFTPGPMNIMSLTLASRDGWRRTLPFTLGAFTSFCTVLLLGAFANLVLYDVLPRVQLYMSIVGGLYMGYLAYKLLRAAWRPVDDASEREGEVRGGFWAAVALQAVNPKGMLYGLTVMGTFILPVTRSPWMLTLAAAGLAVLGLMSTNAWALFGSLFQRILKQHVRAFNTAMAALLAYCAVSLFLH